MVLCALTILKNWMLCINCSAVKPRHARLRTHLELFHDSKGHPLRSHASICVDKNEALPAVKYRNLFSLKRDAAVLAAFSESIGRQL